MSGLKSALPSKKARTQELCLLNFDKEKVEGKSQFIRRTPEPSLQPLHKDKIHHNHLQLIQTRSKKEKNPKEPRHFVRRPPYPTELLKQPYPVKYIVPNFSRFDGRKGSVLVRISKFIDSMEAYAGNGDLCLREFSKSLDDRAYTWYTTLPPGSVKTWEDMVELFCGKYFQAEEKITLVNLHTTKQVSGEDLLQYIHCFRDISLDCYANYEKGELVRVCIDNMLPKFRAHLENLDISRVAQLLQKAQKMALLVKPFEEPPPLVPCTMEEMIAILNKWVADGIFKLPESPKKATEEDKKNPKKFHEKIQDGTLELPQAWKKVYTNPFLKHKYKVVVSVVIHGNASDADMDESAATSTAMMPTAIKTLQRNPRFRSLFNQLWLNPEACTVAIEAIMAIAVESGAHCFTAGMHANHRRPLYLSAIINEVQVRRALVDTGSYINLIPLSILRAIEISQKKIQGAPMEIKDFVGIGEYTKGHIQLVLKVGPIIALTRCAGANCPQQEAPKLGEGILQPSCVTVNEVNGPESVDATAGESTAADPKISAKEELEASGIAYEDLPSGGRSSNYSRGEEATFSRLYQANTTLTVAVQHSPREEEEWPNLMLCGFPGYNQIFMFPKDVEKTAFHTPIGNFYYTVIPFGLKNAEATYQRTTTAMFHDMMHREIEDYVDDIVVKSKTNEDHFGILKKVFERCRLYKLKMNPLKCAFGVSAGNFLGFLVHQRGIDVDPTRASAIATMKPPTSHKELKSFLGKLSYIKRFIPGLAAMTSTFAPLLKKGAPFHWSTECQQAFEKIVTETPTAIKSQDIVDLLAQFPRKDNSSILDEVPGEIDEVFLADLADSTWTLRFNGSSTTASGGAGIVLYKGNGEAVTKSFKLDFPCSNNAAEYETYLAGLAIAYEMGIKHFRVIAFESEKMEVTICKKMEPITELLKKEFEELSPDQEDWRTSIKAKLVSLAVIANLREIKDYTLIFGDLYRRLPGGVLAWCISMQEKQQTCKVNVLLANSIIATKRRMWRASRKEVALLMFAHIWLLLADNEEGYDVLLAYRSSPKTATSFTPFSLVCGTDTISPTELVVPSPRVMQGSELEVDANMCAEARMADLEGLDEARELAKARRQMVLKAAEFVRRSLPSPSKFSPNWDGPYIIREAHESGYYKLSKSDGTILVDPINGK
uniref:RNase H type-1 domain-containing protein n=1 Tax=Fagus sylvatica TaxID=28930 RepID=A0A2N9GYU2_FAGSY